MGALRGGASDRRSGPVLPTRLARRLRDRGHQAADAPDTGGERVYVFMDTGIETPPISENLMGRRIHGANLAKPVSPGRGYPFRVIGAAESDSGRSRLPRRPQSGHDWLLELTGRIGGREI
ncbi:MAG: hypothetical protein GY708_07945 [Actinomycetia bacterium]|nr:hypothetical protein [Actinomycetes bacterium]